MLGLLMSLNDKINSLVWGPYMLLVLVGVGVYITIRTRCIQFSQFGLVMRETMGKIFRRGPAAEGDITPFQAMTVAMGGTVGVGNIAGVATAIALGGPGAIFWMLVSGLVGMGTKFAEVVLGVHFRRRQEGEPMMGGPMMYIERGLGRNWKWLAILFCIFGALAGLGIGNMTQAQAVADGMEKTFGVSHWITGLVLLVGVGLVTIGGIKRIANVAMFFVPFMCTLYLLGALIIIIFNLPQVPGVIALIIRSAFSPKAALGGAAGAGIMMALRWGIARGVFSNEAGLGSAPMAHATARTDHPARQGLWGIFEVFFDTIIMCSATALVILLTGAWQTDANGAKLTMTAFGRFYGSGIGNTVVTFSMVLTAYDTILAWCFYGETCTSYIFGRGKTVRMVYRVIWLPFILLGALGRLDVIWKVSDTLNGLMAIPNLIAILALGGVVVKLTKGFLAGEQYLPPEEMN